MTNCRIRHANSGRPATTAAGRLLAFARETSQRARPLIYVIAALCLCKVPALPAQTMIEGSAIITSRSGLVQASNASGQAVATKPHKVLQPEGLRISTQQDGQLFLTFSNAVAIALNEETALQCLEYSQQSFKNEDLSPGFEPSTSKLRLQLSQGQLAIASNRLSPLSELRIHLPKGEVRLHKGTCLIQLDTTGLHITAYEGNLTYYYPQQQAREFISAPKSVRISEQSIERQQIAEATTVESLDAAETQLCQAAQHASKRVVFQANARADAPPVPVLIVSPDYFKQADLRPYQFND
ncbi:hypothetical protein SH580_17730 [Coraliomargarita algicola]|uniref:FecR protein domain-containing protein n=1 Tax=Coraliomargarita algicola TaxID=3092156 RepID=A0ABZ0RGH2_9BACT|nr:hypothetical protein [Coraliomargarita sp. J2-16]WPJ95265.1 hypothetical protein SH580_17730 [Coraliomargarita sp. J2-16]